MNTFLIGLISFVLLQRAGELLIARRNAEIILSRGGNEVGADHYKFIVLLHILFFLSALGEAYLTGVHPARWWALPFSLFMAAQAVRYWCIRSLGTFWNTRIYVLPGSSPVRKGPYQYLRHPNYLVVTVEMLCLPLIFGLYITAFVFPVLNMWLLRTVRIPVEEQALAEAQRSK